MAPGPLQLKQSKPLFNDKTNIWICYKWEVWRLLSQKYAKMANNVTVILTDMLGSLKQIEDNPISPPWLKTSQLRGFCSDSSRTTPSLPSLKCIKKCSLFIRIVDKQFQTQGQLCFNAKKLVIYPKNVTFGLLSKLHQWLLFWNSFETQVLY